MNLFKTLELLIDRPETLGAAERPEGLGRTGLLGYFTGTLGLFVFLRMQYAIPPGIPSFLVVLMFVLAANFLFAAVMHLFMDLTGVRGSASRLFLAFGCSDYLLTLLVPMGFFSGLDVLNGFVWLCLCFLAVIYARVRLVRRLYPVSINKAVLSVWLPYAGFSVIFFSVFIYGLAWLIWLVV
jgi:hypothetical protein